MSVAEGKYFKLWQGQKIKEKYNITFNEVLY